MKSNNTLIYDINKICEFVFGNPNEKSSEVEILERLDYDDEGNEMKPSFKEVREVKTHDYTGQNSIRYSLIKSFIDTLDMVEDINEMTLGQEITYNTMESYELIKDINK